MRARSLGKAGPRVSELALGTWGLSGDGYGPVPEAEQEAVLRRALEMGFTLIDTADAYADGHMEELIGRAIAGRDDVVVVTKGGTDRAASPARKRFDPAFLRNSVEGSLARLGRERIEVYLLHNPSESALTNSGAVDTAIELKKEGKIGQWGVSVGDVATGRAALQAGADVIEIAYNLFHSTDLHRLAGEVIVAGAGVLARSTLAYGLLSGTFRDDRVFPPEDHRAERWTKPELQRRIAQLGAIHFLVNADVRSLTAAAIRFVLANSLVSAAVLGPRSVAQLEKTVREVGMGPVYIREADLSRLPRALESAGVES